MSEATWHQWLEPLDARAPRTTRSSSRRPTPSPRLGGATASGGCCRRARRPCSGPRSHVELVAPGATPRRRGARRRVARRPPRRRRVNPRLTFDQFVIGDSNRLAHAAALAVAELPGLAYNPLFICGPPGLGKTHLLHSIANYVRAYGDGLTVRYTTAETFTNHFIGALHGGDASLQGAYRGVDVLLVDDVQFLQAKVKTEEEFFHTFNALHEAGAQLVLTSDRPPRDLDALEDRLRERFEAGLVTDVAPARPRTRLTILRKRVLQDGIEGVDPDAARAHRRPRRPTTSARSRAR